MKGIHVVVLDQSFYLRANGNHQSIILNRCGPEGSLSEEVLKRITELEEGTNNMANEKAGSCAKKLAREYKVEEVRLEKSNREREQLVEEAHKEVIRNYLHTLEDRVQQFVAHGVPPVGRYSRGSIEEMLKLLMCSTEDHATNNNRGRGLPHSEDTDNSVGASAGTSSQLTSKRQDPNG
ncbi:hypothetical protein Salat_0511600 [Sesamum alatum]|uniref:Uncharacterized protein n=1 Tax=Sesamum alatum TaxID=300844 RepID=A0AAE2D0R8_9LAMI|nr:hypothetical protein Salat_0511600 [Sesamum alatum]